MMMVACVPDYKEVHHTVLSQYTASDSSDIQSQAYLFEINCSLLSIIFYQKALQPGSEWYANKLYGFVPPITVEEATSLCSEGYSEIDDFEMS